MERFQWSLDIMANHRRTEPNLYKPAHPPTDLPLITSPPPIQTDHNHSETLPERYLLEYLQEIFASFIVMPQGTDQSHAVGDSIVPQKLQEKLPQKVEEKVPNVIHDTGVTGAKSHATGDSAVPKVAQEAVPKKAEEVLPEKVHPTN